MVKISVPLGEYAPDTPDVALGGSPGDLHKVNNVIPRSAESYGPMSDMDTYSSNALEEQCRGASAVIGLDGGTSIFASTRTKLYRLTGRDLTDVSKTGGYSIPDDTIWQFCNYGNDVVATNLAHPIQLFTLGTSTLFGDLSANAPKAKYACVYKNFLITGNNIDPVYGTTPHSIWWSGIGDPTAWPAPGSPTAFAQQSDRREVSGSHGEVMGLAPGIGGGVAVIMRHGVFRLTYVGSPLVFELDAVENLRGAMAPASIAVSGGIVYYLGEDGFYAFDGASARPIGNNRVNKAFFNEADPGGIPTVSSAVDPINYIIFWCYNGTRYIAYNFMIDRWAVGDLAIEWLFRAFVPGVTLEQIGDIYQTLEEIPFSLDSRVWQGGATVLAMFNKQHKLCFLTGLAKEALLETEDAHMNGRVFSVLGARPFTDATNFMIATGSRFVSNGEVSYSTATEPNSDGVAPQRSAGRYVRMKITIPAGTSWTNCQGVEADVAQDGLR